MYSNFDRRIISFTNSKNFFNHKISPAPPAFLRGKAEKICEKYRHPNSNNYSLNEVKLINENIAFNMYDNSI